MLVHVSMQILKLNFGSKKPNGMVMNRPKLKISPKLIREDFEYALKSTNRLKLHVTAVFHNNKSRQKN